MEICSSSSTSCFNLALDDYLQSYHISSSSSTSCFDLALDCLAQLKNLFSGLPLVLDFRKIEFLEAEVLLLKTFFLYVKKFWRRKHEALLELDQEEDKGHTMSESLRHRIICFRFQDVVASIIHDLHSALLRYEPYSHEWAGFFEGVLLRFREKIKLFLVTDVKEQCIGVLLDYYPSRDPRLVMDLVDSLSVTLEDFFQKKQKMLILSRNLIGFATMRGVEHMQLIDLLNHVEEVAADLISMCQFDIFNEEVSNEISQLIHKKINPLDPHVRDIYVHVLTASKESRSSYASALEGTKYATYNFIDSVANYLEDLLKSYSSSPDLVNVPLVKLYQEVRFLGMLCKKEKRFPSIPYQEEELSDELLNLIRVVVCDAGILIFSLSDDEMKEGLNEETLLMLIQLLKVLKHIMAELTHIYLPMSPSSSFSFPRTNELGSIDFFLQNLKQVARFDKINDSIAFPVDKILAVQEDLKFLRSFLEKIKEQRNQNENLQAFWSHIMEVAYKAELVIDLTVVGDELESCLDAVARDINVLKIEAQEIYCSIRYDGDTETYTRMPSQATPAIYNEDLVGLDDKVKAITQRLTSGLKQLEVVPIVGMPGLGKTTLANKVYSSRSVISYFHVRAWCSVSQTYSKHKLLVQILCSINSGNSHQYLEMDEDDLTAELKKVLLRNRYLLVLDDLWDVEAWNLLERSLPDDANRSRILFTSRSQNLCFQIKHDSMPYYLCQLSDEESWELLQKKLFGKEECPPTLSEVGFQIAKKCRGLPLMVVVVAGILATTAQDCWEKVAESLSSIVLDEEYCMKTLELSYSHLPDYLKPCLLYFGAFQEDEDISVRRLLWLWTSEGVVQKTEGKNLDEVAENYLMALISKSLVMVTKQRSIGGAKACRLHDLVREFCLKKSKEENFLHIVHSSKEQSSLIGQSNSHRVCFHNTELLRILQLSFPTLRCLLLLDTIREVEDLGILLPRLLRVLDMRNMEFCKSFPMEVLLLVHLRYLALRFTQESIPSAIANLSRLETFLVAPRCSSYLLPSTIWSIKTLRHLVMTSSKQGFRFPTDNVEGSPDLKHLETLSLSIDPSSQCLQKILSKLPSIRRLDCTRIGRLARMRGASSQPIKNCNRILVFDCLSEVQTLSLNGFDGYKFKFPLNLKKLKLWRNRQPWNEISTIGELPNLEVLILQRDSFVGENCEMKEGEFPNLRVLKLSNLQISNWIACSDNFFCLEKLILFNCGMLNEVPSCLEESQNLEMIEVKGCGNSLASSVMQIQQDQMDLGNQDLRINVERWE